MLQGALKTVCSSRAAPPWALFSFSIRGLKTKGAVKKRFRISSKGNNLKRARAGKNHNTGPLPRRMVRERGESVNVQGVWKRKILSMFG